MKFLKEILRLMKGKKTYSISVLLAVYSALKVFGLLQFTQDQDLAILGIFAALFGVSLRDAIK